MFGIAHRGDNPSWTNHFAYFLRRLHTGQLDDGVANYDTFLHSDNVPIFIFCPKKNTIEFYQAYKSVVAVGASVLEPRYLSC